MYESIINLLKEMDFQFWWPVDINYHNKNEGDWRIEIIIGAILTPVSYTHLTLPTNREV